MAAGNIIFTDTAKDAYASTHRAIKVENIAYKYPKRAQYVLSGFSARFERGEITAVTGKNGCGKTTLTKLLVGILRPSAGRVVIDDLETISMDLFEIGQIVGYVFQNPNRQLFCDTVYNEVAYGLRSQCLDEDLITQNTERCLELFGLSRYKDTYPGKLSLGEKQRLALAAVIALGTDYLVLDEPTSGLDALSQRELGELLRKLRSELNCGIIFASHEHGFISRCSDRELVMPE